MRRRRFPLKQLIIALVLCSWACPFVLPAVELPFRILGWIQNNWWRLGVLLDYITEAGEAVGGVETIYVIVITLAFLLIAGEILVLLSSKSKVAAAGGLIIFSAIFFELMFVLWYRNPDSVAFMWPNWLLIDGSVCSAVGLATHFSRRRRVRSVRLLRMLLTLIALVATMLLVAQVITLNGV